MNPKSRLHERLIDNGLALTLFPLACVVAIVAVLCAGAGVAGLVAAVVAMIAGAVATLGLMERMLADDADEEQALESA
jgi:NAD/NADP transhydrogenase alpha subunit